MWHIAEAMVRWLAPILSFTAEEIWRFLPGKRPASVLLATWHELPEAPDPGLAASTGRACWASGRLAARALEAQREAGDYRFRPGCGLTIYADGGLRAQLEQLGEELRFLFITSAAEVRAAAERPAEALAGGGYENYWVVAVPVSDAKCVRCWQQRPDTGAGPVHPELCGRCVINLDGSGESRRFV